MDFSPVTEEKSFLLRGLKCSLNAPKKLHLPIKDTNRESAFFFKKNVRHFQGQIIGFCCIMFTVSLKIRLRRSQS